MEAKQKIPETQRLPHFRQAIDFVMRRTVSKPEVEGASDPINREPVNMSENLGPVLDPEGFEDQEPQVEDWQDIPVSPDHGPPTLRPH